MPQTSFDGSSKSGSIQQALDNAIQAAKDTLQTDLVTWKFERLSGQDGGVVEAHNLTISITATAGLPK